MDLEESRESKRRRTLEYPSESSQSEVASHETGSPFVTSEVFRLLLVLVMFQIPLFCYSLHIVVTFVLLIHFSGSRGFIVLH